MNIFIVRLTSTDRANSSFLYYPSLELITAWPPLLKRLATDFKIHQAVLPRISFSLTLARTRLGFRHARISLTLSLSRFVTQIQGVQGTDAADVRGAPLRSRVRGAEFEGVRDAGASNERAR